MLNIDEKNQFKKSIFLIFAIMLFCLSTSPSFASLSSSFTSPNQETSKISFENFETLLNSKNYVDLTVYKKDLLYNADSWIELSNNVNSSGLSLRNIVENYGGFVYIDWPEYADSDVLIPNENYSEFVNKAISFGFDVKNTTYLRTFLDESRSLIGLPYYKSSTSTELTGRGIKIAIVDTGINCTHPDINDCNPDGSGKLLFWNDNIANNWTPYDDNGHGTHVASIAAGTGAASNGKYKGIAPNSSLIIEKSCYSDGSCNPQFLALGIQDAISHNPDIISMSLGIPEPTTSYCDCTTTEPDVRAICDAVQNALNHNIIVVAAAGNEGNPPKHIGQPGCINGVIAVGASFKNSYSNDFFSSNMDFPHDDIIYARVHVIATLITDNPPQVNDSEWNATSSPFPGGFQWKLTPKNWPATVKVQVEAEHRNHDCFSDERIWWDPGYADKGDEYWTWNKTFYYDPLKPNILVEIGAESYFGGNGCMFDTEWKNYFNDYTCSGNAKACNDFDSNKDACKNQAGCGWCGCQLCLINRDTGRCFSSSCYPDMSKAQCDSQQGDFTHQWSWLGCEGTPKACSDRSQNNGEICGTSSTTGCTASWNKDENTFVKFSMINGWGGVPVFPSSRGPPIQDSSLIKPLITAPGVHICAARAFEGQDIGVSDCGNNNYVSISGTSMATPMVSGLVALMKEASPAASYNVIVGSLEQADQKLFSPYPNFEEGYGLVDAQKSIDSLTNCALKISYDTGDSGNNPLVAGGCFDYTAWLGSSCVGVQRIDRCLGNTLLLEWYASGSTCSSYPKNCKEYGSNYICSDGKCMVQPPPPTCQSLGGVCMSGSGGCITYCKRKGLSGYSEPSVSTLGYYPGCSMGNVCCICG